MLQPRCNGNIILHEWWYITLDKYISPYKSTGILNLWIISLVDNCKKKIFFFKYFANCNKWLWNQLKLLLCIRKKPFQTIFVFSCLSDPLAVTLTDSAQTNFKHIKKLLFSSDLFTSIHFIFCHRTHPSRIIFYTFFLLMFHVQCLHQKWLKGLL